MLHKWLQKIFLSIDLSLQKLAFSDVRDFFFAFIRLIDREINTEGVSSVVAMTKLRRRALSC